MAASAAMGAAAASTRAAVRATATAASTTPHKAIARQLAHTALNNPHEEHKSPNKVTWNEQPTVHRHHTHYKTPTRPKRRRRKAATRLCVQPPTRSRAQPSIPVVKSLSPLPHKARRRSSHPTASAHSAAQCAHRGYAPMDPSRVSTPDAQEKHPVEQRAPVPLQQTYITRRAQRKAQHTAERRRHDRYPPPASQTVATLTLPLNTPSPPNNTI